MNTHCVVCDASIYDSVYDVCCDCEHKEKPHTFNLDWRYQMHRAIAAARMNNEGATCTEQS